MVNVPLSYLVIKAQVNFLNHPGKTSFIKLIKGDFDLDAKPTRLIDFYTMKKQGA